ncbi:hypothetical protein AH06_107 [Erwinia phage AH06]|nr:hypothetical protein AH06_107 [Erwinia phage AH06]
MSEQQPKIPTRLKINVAGNHPLLATAAAAAIADVFTKLNVAGERPSQWSIDGDYAQQLLQELAADQNNTIDVHADPLTVAVMQGKTEVWDWPIWNNPDEPWTALVTDELRGLWSSFTSVQKRAIYYTLTGMNIVVEDDEMTIAKAQDIINESEVYVDLRNPREDGSFASVVVDGNVYADVFAAIVFLYQNARVEEPLPAEEITKEVVSGPAVDANGKPIDFTVDPDDLPSVSAEQPSFAAPQENNPVSSGSVTPYHGNDSVED